jgi:hypothetical protein
VKYLFSSQRGQVFEKGPYRFDHYPVKTLFSGKKALKRHKNPLITIFNNHFRWLNFTQHWLNFTQRWLNFPRHRDTEGGSEPDSSIVFT